MYRTYVLVQTEISFYVFEFTFLISSVTMATVENLVSTIDLLTHRQRFPHCSPCHTNPTYYDRRVDQSGKSIKGNLMFY